LKKTEKYLTERYGKRALWIFDILCTAASKCGGMKRLGKATQNVEG
jgi:hypothetical protein